MPDFDPFKTSPLAKNSTDTKNYLCQCCFIHPVRMPISHTEKLQPICTLCTSHWGRLDPTIRAHQGIVGEFMRERNAKVRELQLAAKNSQEAAEAAQASLAEIEAYIAGEYEDKPIGDMHAALESAIIKDALSKRDRAYSARNRIFVSLYGLDDDHREAAHGRCECGKALKDCREYQAIKPISAEYYRWENEQIDRMNLGQTHGLAYDHPKSREWRRQHPGEWWRGAHE